MKWLSAIARMLTGGWIKTCLLFLVVLSVLLYGVFLPAHTLFSNDGPLGQLMAQCHRLPGRFWGCWLDLNSIGFNGGAASPNIPLILQWLLGPVLFSKFFAIVSLLILGLSAWIFLRQMRLAPLACVLGGLAALLNSTFFSVACWGMSAHVLTAAMAFLALAALADPAARLRWLRVILAGMAVGMGVATGADVGAIFSLYVAAFIVYQAWMTGDSRTKGLVLGLGRLALVTVCALLVAASSIYSLITTAIEGQVGTQQHVQTKEQRWDWATQWSLPKSEALGFVVPGLFGYRMDTPNGGMYWGLIGQDPVWENYDPDDSQSQPPAGFFRYSGGGYYEGVLVMLVAFWAAIQSLRRKHSLYNSAQRRWLWFWLGVAVLSLLLGFGRFAPFYRWFYALPYASTIRNPIKFLYLFSFAVVVLFAFGVDALWRGYLQPTGAKPQARWAGVDSWFHRATRFEKNWVYGCGAVWVVSLLAWLDYAEHRQALEQYLQSVQINSAFVNSVARFSIHEVGWFILFFLLAAGLQVLIFSGAFTGRRAGLGGLLLAALLVADLGMANQPWIVYWNYQYKYASNPIINILRNKPYEHRVALAPLTLPPDLRILGQLYNDEWLQQQFPFYNVQSSDLVEARTMPKDLSAFLNALNETNANQAWLTSRLWQLTNTRYILGPQSLNDFWSQQAGLSQSPLLMVARFSITPKPGVLKAVNFDQLTAVPDNEGPFALFEFTAALPRAKLYEHWQVDANNSSVLKELFNPAFNPQTSVFVGGRVPVNSGTVSTNQTAESVHFISYAPKDIVLKAEAGLPSILLLNDHYDPNWKVLVDGKPEKLLRCNFLMQGVYLLPGTHTVEFRFRPPIGLLYVSLVAEAAGLLALGILLASNRRNRLARPQPGPPTSNPLPVAQPKRNRDSAKKTARTIG